MALNIVCCVKQVPDPETPASAFRVDEGSKKVVPAPGIAPVISQFDAIAVEAALRIRDAKGEGKITVLSLGPDSARDVIKDMAAYLPQLPESTALVLVEKRDLPERNPVLKAASGAEWAVVRRFELPKGKDLVDWIRKRAKREAGEFSREAAQALADVEDDPRGLGSEIEKLLTYVDRARPVELDDVQTLTPAGGERYARAILDVVADDL